MALPVESLCGLSSRPIWLVWFVLSILSVLFINARSTVEQPFEMIYFGSAGARISKSFCVANFCSIRPELLMVVHHRGCRAFKSPIMIVLPLVTSLMFSRMFSTVAADGRGLMQMPLTVMSLMFKLTA